MNESTFFLNPKRNAIIRRETTAYNIDYKYHKFILDSKEISLYVIENEYGISIPVWEGKKAGQILSKLRIYKRHK